MLVAVDLLWEMAGHWLRLISARRAQFLTGAACPLTSVWNMGLLKLTSFVFS